MMLRTAVGLILLIAATSVTGCGGVADTVARPPSARPALLPPATAPSAELPEGAGCVAAGAESAIGQAASPLLLEQTRLAAKAAVARFLRPNQAVTMEYSAARLNLELDGKDIVRAVRCG